MGHVALVGAVVSGPLRFARGGLCSYESPFKKRQQRRSYYYKCSKAAHHTKEHCSARDLPADELESLVLSVVRSLVDNEPFLDSVIKQIEGNSTADAKQMDDDIRDLSANPSKATNELENLLRLHAASSGISDSEVLSKMVREREEDRTSIKTKISSLERQREDRWEQRGQEGCAGCAVRLPLAV